MLPNVHLGKGASVSYPHHFNSEVPEEINDLQRFPPQTEDQDDGSHHRTEQLLQNKSLEEIQSGKTNATYSGSRVGFNKYIKSHTEHCNFKWIVSIRKNLIKFLRQLIVKQKSMFGGVFTISSFKL